MELRNGTNEHGFRKKKKKEKKEKNCKNPFHQKRKRNGNVNLPEERLYFPRFFLLARCTANETPDRRGCAIPWWI